MLEIAAIAAKSRCLSPIRLRISRSACMRSRALPAARRRDVAARHDRTWHDRPQAPSLLGRAGSPRLSDHGGSAPRGLRLKSEIPDQAAQPPRQLIIEWTTQL